MAGVQQSFGEQAARFSLYAPFAVMGISTLSAGARHEAGVKIALFVISTVLLIAGLGLGIVALISTRRFGTDRILTRAILGVVLNGMAIVLLAVFLLPLLATGRVKTQVVGHWHMQHSVPPPPNGPLDITLNSDGTFELDGKLPTGVPLAIKGTWTMNRSREIDVRFVSVNDKAADPASKPIGLGIVRSVSDTQLSLKTDSGQEDYDRVP